jgi:hypothetical protein
MMRLAWSAADFKYETVFHFSFNFSYREIIMPNQDEPNKTDQPLSSTDSGDIAENVADNIKTLLLFIGGVVLVLSILVLLPMLLTYLSEGDFRAVGGGDHPTDTARKSSHNAYKPDK